MQYYLTFVRHGSYGADKSLTEEGKSQLCSSAFMIKDIVTGNLKNMPFSNIPLPSILFTSQIKRAKESSHIFCHQLKELGINLPLKENISCLNPLDELLSIKTDLHQRVLPDEVEHLIQTDFYRDMVRFIKDHLTPENRHLILLTHKPNIELAALCFSDGYKRGRLKIGNGDIYTIEITVPENLGKKKYPSFHKALPRFDENKIIQSICYKRHTTSL